MSKIEDGGPAFPQLDVVAGERDGHGDPIEAFSAASGGMSLRDYFAGQALVGLVAIYENVERRHVHAAIDAYEFADAMLKARGAAHE